jgi:hypothetical protein
MGGRVENLIVAFLSLRRIGGPCLVAVSMALSLPAWGQTPPAPTPSDGTWIGRAEGGRCDALEVRITVESGLLDGTATEPDAAPMRITGKRGEKLPAPPALWQLNGRVGPDGTISIIGLRSMVNRDREHSRWSGRALADSFTIAETDGPCRRTASLKRGQ